MKSIRLMVAVAAVAIGQLAYAHSELVSSTPADRAALDVAPKDLTLNFSEPVRLTALAVQKVGEAKQNLGPLPTNTATAFTVAAPTLANGQYIVTWRALSEDTHVMTGELAFAVGAGQMPPAHAQGATGQHMDQHMQGHEDGAHMEHSEAH